jgi:hypothetical protein
MSLRGLSSVLWAVLLAFAPFAAAPVQAGPLLLRASDADPSALVLAPDVPFACFSEYTGDNSVDFSSGDASALRNALAAVPPGGIVKVAGTCAGATVEAGGSQVGLITKTMTLMGGYTQLNWAASYPITQPTTLDALGGGRVLSVSVAATIANLIARNGMASGGDGGAIYASDGLTLSAVGVLSSASASSGGGLFANGAVVLLEGVFEGNVALHGGGLFTNRTLALTGTRFVGNTAQGYGGGAFAYGAATLNGGEFRSNQSLSLNGGGLGAYATLALSGTRFIDNVAFYSGGGVTAVGPMTVTGAEFAGNRALTYYGGGLTVSQDLSIMNSRFVSNTARGLGGGLWQFAGIGRIVNALFDRNASEGAVLYFDQTRLVSVIHTTIASPTVASSNAIAVVTGTLNVSNTIIASHTIGISRTGGTVNEDFNLFFGNLADRTLGVPTGPNSVHGNPLFVDSWAGDDHIGPASAALDVGVDAGVTTDFEGNPRPLGGGFDIGYDERLPPRAYLPLVAR